MNREDLNKKRDELAWYKDRDFMEIKSGNDDVVAYIPNSDQLWRIINAHNNLISKITQLEKENAELKKNFEDEHRYFGEEITEHLATKEKLSILTRKLEIATKALEDLYKDDVILDHHQLIIDKALEKIK